MPKRSAEDLYLDGLAGRISGTLDGETIENATMALAGCLAVCISQAKNPDKLTAKLFEFVNATVKQALENDANCIERTH